MSAQTGWMPLNKAQHEDRYEALHWGSRLCSSRSLSFLVPEDASPSGCTAPQWIVCPHEHSFQSRSQ